MKYRPRNQSIIATSIILGLMGSSCNSLKITKEKRTIETQDSKGAKLNDENDFNYIAEQFADLRILRYQIPEFDKLSLKQKELLYYLSEAAAAGRDIFWDQGYRHNLSIRRTLEQIVEHYKGDRESENFKKFLVYAKRVWFSNGIHHHYSNDKIAPNFPAEYFAELVANSASDKFPTHAGETKDDLVKRLSPIIFDPSIDAKRVNLDSGVDLVRGSAVNLYRNLSQKEAEDYYNSLIDPNDKTPISYGLNSRLEKDADGKIRENVYRVGGLYGAAIKEIVGWLRKAIPVAETELQKKSIEQLIAFYETGDLKKFDEYNISWVQDTEPVVDFVNGFIEVYHDPLGRKGSWESVVSIKDLDLTKKYGVISSEAPWFEAHSPIAEEHKRKDVRGVSYKIINVVMEGGDSSPSTPIGINLPNANWVREIHGSKSVSLGNIEHAYDQSAKKSGALAEFFLPEAQELIKKHGTLADRLSTGLHEVIGHASGRIMDGVGDPSKTLKNYANALEEARADLVALYYIGDEHLAEMGIVPKADVRDMMKAEYIQFITNGLMRQMARIEEGKDLEEAHMRNRQLIAKWAYEHGKAENVIERVSRTDAEGKSKTYFVINDYDKLRDLFGQLLKEVQRVKSEGDYEAGKSLIETYAVKLDKDLHKEVLARWAALNLAPYAGFINPELQLVQDKDGKITDVKVTYPTDFTEQMLRYGKKYAFLPTEN